MRNCITDYPAESKGNAHIDYFYFQVEVIELGNILI